MKSYFFIQTILFSLLPFQLTNFNIFSWGKKQTPRIEQQHQAPQAERMAEARYFGRFHEALFPKAVSTGAELAQEMRKERFMCGSYKLRKIIIDPGHGGYDPGCLGANSYEKDLALGIAKKVAAKMEAAYPGLEVIMTRDQDVFIPLHKRAEMANKGDADLFISIHCNFMPNASFVKGTETYILGAHRMEENLQVAMRENSSILLEDNFEETYSFDPNSPEGHIILSMYQNAYLEQSISFAHKVEQRMKVNAARRSRGVKQAGFLVLRETAMPSVLIETGFLSNKQEEAYLKTSEGQDQIADAILHAFTDYKYEVEDGIVANVEAPVAQIKKQPISQSVQSVNPTKSKGGSKVTSYEKKPEPKEPEVLASDTVNIFNIKSVAPPQSGSASMDFTPETFGQPVAGAATGTSSKLQSAVREIQGLPEPAQTEESATKKPAAETATAPVAAVEVPETTPAEYDDHAYSGQGDPFFEPQKVPTTQPSPPVLQAKGLEEASYVFKVQVAASKTLLNTNKAPWTNIGYLIKVEQEGEYYKYRAINFRTFDEAKWARIVLQGQGFPDAFIVAYKDGQRVDVDDLKKELGKE